MQSRFLGRTGVRVSSLALGTMGFGTEADESTATAIFARARAAGISLFDCADVYGQGRAEEILGRLLKAAGCRDAVVLTSKGYFPNGDDAGCRHGPPSLNDRGSSRYHLVRAVEASLRRLGTDRIDVYFLHRFDDVTPLEETLRAIEMLVREGKILYPAVSNFAAWQTARALGIAERNGWAPVVCMQPMYNLVKRQAEVELLPLARAEGLGVLSYSPLGGGLLSGKYSRVDRPASGRLVDVPMYRTRYGDSAHYEIAERFVALARARGVSPAALAIAWVASHPAVTAPILGARDVAQLEAGLAAAEIEMDAELYAEIAALSPSPPPATDRNEEASATNYGSR